MLLKGYLLHIQWNDTAMLSETLQDENKNEDEKGREILV